MYRLRLFATAITVSTALLLSSAATFAQTLAPAIKGKEVYKLKQAGIDKDAKVPMSLMVTEDGRLLVNIDDESWTIGIEGKGSKFSFAASDGQVGAIEDAIARDLQGRFSKKFTAKSDRERLKQLVAIEKNLAAEIAALQTSEASVSTRIQNLLSGGGGGPVSASLLIQLRDDLARLAAESQAARAEQSDVNNRINYFRRLVSPAFQVTIKQGGFIMKLKLNKNETKAKLLAKLSFVATNLHTGESFAGSRSVKGKGKIVSLR